MKNLERPLLSILAVALAIVLLQPGCSKEEMGDMMAKAKDTASEFKEKSGDALEKAKAGASGAAKKIKDTASGAVTSVKEKSSSLASSAGNLVSANGSAKITLDAPTDFPASYVRVVPVGDGQSVVQLKSYPKGGEATGFPAFFMQALSNHTETGSLDGSVVPCRFFAQKKADGDVWENAPGKLVSVQFKKTEDGLSASFTDAALVNTANGSQATSSGEFDCVELD